MAGLKSLARGLGAQAKLSAFRDAWYAAKHASNPTKTIDEIYAEYWYECDLAANAAGLRG
jgi:hypothetical protein